MAAAGQYTTHRNSLPALAGKLALWGLALFIIMGAIFNAASTLFEKSNPDLSLSFNPYNPEALYNLAEARFIAGNLDRSGFLQLEQSLKHSLTGNSYDPQAFSLLGHMHELQNRNTANISRINSTEAMAYFDHALRLNQVNFLSLIKKIVYSANINDADNTVDHLAVLRQAWPQKWELVRPYIPQTLADPSAYERARQTFRANAVLKSGLINSLNAYDTGLTQAARLLIDWHEQGEEELEALIARTSAGLFRKKRYDEAWRLFAQTRKPPLNPDNGFVFNSSFDQLTSGNLFDWRLPKRTGISAAYTKAPGTDPNALENVMEVRFLDMPVRLKQDLQRLKLPRSSINPVLVWNVVYRTLDVKGSKPLLLMLRCHQPVKELARLELKPDTRKPEIAQIEFSAPDDKCPTQAIAFSNGNIVESWENRYSGMVQFYSMSITTR